ncbi:hypothetical protein E2562_014845 [Oryza meyeriana var. granulata]|uniref:Wall-associated receptor kinase galacturonan-binding domain-containing protein n=1 Tax=Oryza meyeriana var. granulata TaxID=110450 RepID=A0A6G1BY15_9ORYZ|nr:hypothetical protein E2562_014845 [Oryza meyeriana var. granulata]
MNLNCINVPYPFGLRGKSAPGFRVTCGRNSQAILRIGEHRFRIHYVSPQHGFVVISAGPIRQVCYDRSGRPARITGIKPMNLKGTPFFFSKRNRLVATGCHYSFFANFTGSLGKQNWSTTRCTTQCNGHTDAIINGSCLGTACCKTDMPMDGAQEFTFTFDKTPPNVTGEEAGTCSAAFFLDLEEQIFTNGRDGWQMPLKDALVRFGERRMVLDWVIERVTCEQAASRNNFAPHHHHRCNNVSSCINAPSRAGYFCRCNAGYNQYDGNPYKAGGCIVKIYALTRKRTLACPQSTARMNKESLHVLAQKA